MVEEQRGKEAGEQGSKKVIYLDHKLQISPLSPDPDIEYFSKLLEFWYGHTTQEGLNAYRRLINSGRFICRSHENEQGMMNISLIQNGYITNYDYADLKILKEICDRESIPFQFVPAEPRNADEYLRNVLNEFSND